MSITQLLFFGILSFIPLVLNHVYFSSSASAPHLNDSLYMQSSTR